MKNGVFHFHTATIGRGSTYIRGSKAKRPPRKKLTSPVKTVAYDRGEKMTLQTKEGPVTCRYPKRNPTDTFSRDFGMGGKSAEEFWNLVEKIETRKDAQLAYRFIFGGSIHLTKEQNWECMLEFGKFVNEDLHLPFSLSAHFENPNNPHGHGIVGQRSTHSVNGELAFSRHKCTILNPFVTKGTEGIQAVRAKWADILNQALARHGHQVRVSHLSNEAQGIDLIPTLHEGPKVRYLAARKGIITDRAQENIDIRHANQAIQQRQDAIVSKQRRKHAITTIGQISNSLRLTAVEGLGERARLADSRKRDAEFRSLATKRREREADQAAQPIPGMHGVSPGGPGDTQDLEREIELRERETRAIMQEDQRTEQALARVKQPTVILPVKSQTQPKPTMNEPNTKGPEQLRKFLLAAVDASTAQRLAAPSLENFVFFRRDNVLTGALIENLGEADHVVKLISFPHFKNLDQAVAETTRLIAARKIPFDDLYYEHNLRTAPRTGEMSPTDERAR